MFRSNPRIDRFFSFFTLPKYLLELIRHKQGHKSKLRTTNDLLTLFFAYKTYPDHYGPCRLWEVNKSDWKFYYGSNYQSYQRAKLLREVQPRTYQILFDDKDICERLCREIGVRVPHSFGLINPSENYKAMLRNWLAEVGNTTLFIKPLRGAGGRDIVLVRKDHTGIIVQKKAEKVPLHEFQLNQTSIVQKAIIQDDRMAAFSPSSVNTVRIVTMISKSNLVFVVTAIMRTGVGTSYVDNWSAGGVGIGIEINSGRLMKYGYDKRGNKYTSHPTTGQVFEGFAIPEWDQLTHVALRDQRSLPCYRILGMDLALTKDAEPILVEVNDCPDLMGMEQMAGPLFKNRMNLLSFGGYDLLINKYQRRIYNELLRSTVEAAH